MKTAALAFAVALAVLASLGGTAFAAGADKPVTVAQDTSKEKCDPKKDRAVPLAIRTRTTAIIAAVDPLDYPHRAPMRGACVGTPEFVKNSQPMQVNAKGPYLLSTWDLGSSQPYTGSGPPNYHNF